MAIVADQHQIRHVVQADGIRFERSPSARPIFGKGVDVRHLGEVDGFLRDRRFVKQPVAVAELAARSGF